MSACENWVDISISISTRKTDKFVVCACAYAYAYVVALTSENWVDIAQGRGPIIGHFDPDLMPTYQIQ